MTTGRLGERRGLALGAGEPVELVDIVDGVLVVRQDGKAVGEALEAMLGDQVRPRVERVPTRAVERDRSLQPGRGLIEELLAPQRAKGEALEVIEQALRRPCQSAWARDGSPLAVDGSVKRTPTNLGCPFGLPTASMASSANQL